MVLKSATGSGRRVLRKEAELLRGLAGPGIVASVGLRDSDDRTDLVLLDGGRHDLAGPLALDPAARLRALEECARSLGRLHDAGWVHGAVCGSHVVVELDGTARWCSLGSARPIADDTLVEELDQLRALVESVLAAPCTDWSLADRRRWSRTGTAFGRAVRRDRERNGGAAPPQAAAIGDMVAALHAPRSHRPRTELVPPCAEPEQASNEPAPPDRDRPIRSRTEPVPWRTERVRAIGTALRDDRPFPARRPKILVVATLLSLAAVVTTATMAIQDSSSVADRSASVRSLSSSTPLGVAPKAQAAPGRTGPTATSTPSASIEGNLVRLGDSTFKVGRADDQLAVVDWNSDGTPTALLLRPASGEVFEFAEWATGNQPTSGQSLGTVPDGLEILPAPVDPDGCPGARVRRSDGSLVDLLSTMNPEVHP